MGIEQPLFGTEKNAFRLRGDFHHVLRSKYLCLRFRLANIPVAFICKGEPEKRNWIRRRHKVLENQKSSFRRYADVLEKLGLPVLLNFSSIYGEGKVISQRLNR